MKRFGCIFVLLLAGANATLANIPRTLAYGVAEPFGRAMTVSGSLTGAVTGLGVNGKQAVVYSDGTFATVEPG